MARSLGINTALAIKWESSYGTDPTGNYQLVPFTSIDLGAEQGLLEDDILGLGRDPAATGRDVINVLGSVGVPLDVANIGWWLRALFGDVTATGTDPYTHVFTSGGTPESFAAEIAHPDIPEYFQYLGVFANSITVQMQPSGLAGATVELIGQTENNASSEYGGTQVAAPTVERFNQFQGKIQRNASDLASITAGNFTFSNGMEAVRVVRSDGLVDGVDALKTSLTGSITARFASAQLYDDAVADTAIELIFDYEISASKKITFKAHQVKLPRVRQSISGAGGVEATFNFVAEKDTAEGEMLEVTLINSEADYDIA